MSYSATKRAGIASLIFWLCGLVVSVPAATPPTQTVQVSGTFSDNSDNEEGFYLYRCGGVGCIPTVLVQTLAANSQVFADTIPNDVGGASYTYALSAFNKAGESARVTVTILTPVIIVIPNAPSGIIATITGVAIQ